MINFELIGYLAGLIIAISLTPQVIKVWKTRSTKDISIVWNLFYLVGLSLWIVYGFGIGSLPLMLMVSFEALMAISLLILKIKYG